MQEYSFFVAGEWRRSKIREKVTHPYDNSVIAEVALAEPPDIEAAVVSAVRAFKETRRLPAHRRADILLHIAHAIEQRAEELAGAITDEAGKAIHDSRLEVSRAALTFSLAAEEAKRISGEVVPMDAIPSGEGKLGFTRRFPIGPILAISAFNFPLNLVAHKVAPALAVGNPVLLKPAPQTPVTALKLAEIIDEAGWPAGGLSVLPCRDEVADKLLTDERIAMLSFTGSVEVGWKLKSRCGKKRTLLELGGNGAVIVDADADVDWAARRCALGGFFFSGQVCASVQRLLVHESLYQPFLNKLVRQVMTMTVGDPRNESTRFGPMISAAAAERVAFDIDEALALGAEIVIGGKRHGAMLEPTILTHTTPTMRVNCKEIFGPVVTVEPFTDFEQALSMVNHSNYGLQAGLFTRDVSKVFSAFQEAEVGGLVVNDVPTYRADHGPWGGVKDSGQGREGLRYAIEAMTDIKFLVLNL
ncbi:MAG: aldehyde dehydrogenase family protein [Acidobacteria bacterium]|nr:aldehyde dehydrogenase family protein [Acidobacteriota bacterium]MBI3657599.1 aldehyde dehydrogenase family protein [Acidobacteriota bacterium]